MSDVLLGGTDRKPVPHSLPLVVEPRRREARPPPCRSCAEATWWNGWRVTRPIVVSSTGHIERLEMSLARAKCPRCLHAFTCYPPGIYPRRQFQLDVVAHVVADVAFGAEPVAHAAATVSASSTSARRWTAWVAALTRARELVVAAAQVDPSVATVALPPPSSTRHPRAAAVLAGLEALGTVLVHVGIALVERSGLGRVLGWQHRQHGDVYGVVAGARSFSPAMAPGGRPTTA